MPQCKAPWMLAAKELRSDLPFFGSFGLIAGLVQWVAYHYFDKSNVGTELLQEHIAFRSLVLTVILLWGAKGLLARLSVTEERPRLSAFVEHVAGRAVAFASVAAAVIGAQWFRASDCRDTCRNIKRRPGHAAVADQCLAVSGRFPDSG